MNTIESEFFQVISENIIEDIQLPKLCLSIVEKYAVGFGDFSDDFILQRDGRGNTYYTKPFSSKRYSQSELFQLYIQSLK